MTGLNRELEQLFNAGSLPSSSVAKQEYEAQGGKITATSLELTHSVTDQTLCSEEIDFLHQVII